MEQFPVIDMQELELGDKRGAAMELIRDACENWGFFQVYPTKKNVIYTIFVLNFQYLILGSDLVVQLILAINFEGVEPQNSHHTHG